ncbi:MAG: pantoate--beta-alanine ligase [Planctomycetes bacterium]|nr:pantoate--beta-alanine ligase [Planctomycetota bacterium]
MPSHTTVANLIAVDNLAGLREQLTAARDVEKTIGLVPTMGALHAGHLSLMERARGEVDFLVVTIFVNPKQFGPAEDLGDYPRPLEEDLAACRACGVDLVFHPRRETIYPNGFATTVEVAGLSEVLEGRFRPGHFRGVTTVVVKLLNLVQPDVVYFGRKDFQQQLIIRRMCRDLNLQIDIRVCPTVREPDGLALSSRNAFLSREERRSAVALSECLRIAESMIVREKAGLDDVRAAMRERLEREPNLQIDYATIADAESLEEVTDPVAEMVALVAARVGKTRLIDNLPIKRPEAGVD